jgi:hypothetical protein
MAKIEALRERIRRRHIEKASIGRNMLSEMERFLQKMDTDLAFFETDLKNSGNGGELFGGEQAKLGIEPGSDVAVRPSTDSDEYILGRVIFYNTETSVYEIADADESSTKRYNVHENSVILLDLDYNITTRRLAKGEEIIAVYPETTSFYPAVVVQAPRIGRTLNVEPIVVVQFSDDHDDTGQIPHKTVLLRHVARLPTAAV